MSNNNSRCNMANITLEEEKEKLRQDKKYKGVENENLYIEPIHYQKYDNIKTHIHCHTYAVCSLGDIKGKRILDLGCGTGAFSVILAKRGAIVEGIDISPVAIEIAKRRSVINEVPSINYKAMSFYELDYPNDFFDRIIGLSTLHHARDKKLISDSLHRVLKPGGRIVFREPLGNSRYLEKLRLLVPVPVNEEDKTHWNEQIKYRDLEIFKDKFSVSYQEFQFFSRLDRVFKSRRLIKFLGMLDAQLLEKVSWLRPYARDIVIMLDKK